MSGASVLLTTAVPVLGGLVALVMYATPLQAAYSACKQQQLGELNPTPFAVTFASCSCWCAYGFAAPDKVMFLPNVPGVAAAMYTTATCYALASRQVQDVLLAILCSTCVIVPLLGVMTRFVMAAAQARLMWGIVCLLITVAYYSAPVSSAVKVVRTRNSAAIYRPTCIANLCNAALWVAYGAAMSDLFIWLPNGIGGLMSLLLLGLTVAFPAAPAATTSNSSGSGGGLTAPLNASGKSSGGWQHQPHRGHHKRGSGGLSQQRAAARRQYRASSHSEAVHRIRATAAAPQQPALISELMRHERAPA